MGELLSLSIFAAALLVAAPAPPAIKVAVPELQSVNMTRQLTEFCSEHLAQGLAANGLEVTTSREIAAILGLERQKQLAGCAGDSCLSELANALGSEALVLGDVAKLEQSYRVNLKVIDAQSGKRAAQFSATASSDEGLIIALTNAADTLARETAAHYGRPLAPRRPQVEASSTRAPIRPWIPAIAAGVMLVGGGVGLSMAKSDYDAIRRNPATLEEANSLRASGARAQTLGWIGLGAGLAAATGAGVLFLMDGSDGSMTATAQIGPNGAGLALGGTLP